MPDTAAVTPWATSANLGQTRPWPGAADLGAFINSLNLPGKISADTPTLFRLGLAMDAAIEKWQALTCFPFLMTETTLAFDPPGPDKGPVGLYSGLASVGGGDKLFLPAGLWGLTDGGGNAATTLLTGVSETDPDGQVLTLGQDFWLRPNNAAFQGKPASIVQFRTAQYGQPQSIQITGRWGRCRTLPADVWLALLQDGLVSLAPNLALNVSGGVYEWREGDEMKRFGGAGDSSPLSAEVKQWTGLVEQAAVRYQRVAIL